MILRQLKTDREIHTRSLFSFRRYWENACRHHSFLICYCRKDCFLHPITEFILSINPITISVRRKYIPIYTTPQNIGVFQLADDIERLPSTRKKLPIGARLNYYINEMFVLRTYYRYYVDDWGIQAHTINVDLPVKLKPGIFHNSLVPFLYPKSGKLFCAI